MVITIAQTPDGLDARHEMSTPVQIRRGSHTDVNLPKRQPDSLPCGGYSVITKLNGNGRQRAITLALAARRGQTGLVSKELLISKR